MGSLNIIITDSFTSPASMFTWLALLSFFFLVVVIPILIFTMRSKRSFLFAIAASFVPLICGLAGFTNCLMQIHKALPNVPEAQRAEAYKIGMQVAYSSLWPSILTVLFLGFSILAYKFIPKKSSTDMKLEEPGELATRGRRLIGSLIDGLIIAILFLPLYFAIAKGSSLQNLSIYQQIILSLASILIYVAINGYLIYKNGQTIAKKLLGMKMVDYKSNTNANVFKVIFLRYGILIALNLVPFIGNLFGFVNPLFIFGKERRCLHDLIAGTKVVNI